MQSKQNQVGFFITQDMWEDSLTLLNLQVGLIDKIKHFNTFSMFYYKKLGKQTKQLEAADYFHNKIANNLFYGLQKEFHETSYLIPKAGLGLRKYKFLSYPMRALYYTFGIYLLHLSAEFLHQYASNRDKIMSFYGGKLHLEDNRLKPSKNNIYYLDQYKKFRKAVRAEADGDLFHKVVIKLDIQNYFDEISIATLLNLLTENIKPSIQQQKQFTPSTREQIEFFFRYLMNSNSGIPQADNDIISSFIGYLYLVFGDLRIEDILRSLHPTVADYKIIRYVDDMYISITFDPTASAEKREDTVNLLGNWIADNLHQTLNLRLNPKTRFFWMNMTSLKKGHDMV